jgi:hypothetical protein
MLIPSQLSTQRFFVLVWALWSPENHGGNFEGPLERAVEITERLMRHIVAGWLELAGFSLGLLRLLCSFTFTPPTPAHRLVCARIYLAPTFPGPFCRLTATYPKSAKPSFL